MKLSDIHIRDPFILTWNNKYYLYGSRGSECWGLCTGLDVFVSSDLESWSQPIEVFKKPENFWADKHFWAPEVHEYKGSFYMFVSFKSDEKCRGTQILISNSPLGPFCLHSNGPVTPKNWECLDGTLYIDKKGTPFLVFCHEWLQVKDGEMCAVRLSDDLKNAIGEPLILFHASEPYWADKQKETFVTDGPFLYRCKNGKLIMIWSSSNKDNYLQAVSISENGEIDGKWNHNVDLLFSKDGRHGMIFKDFKGKLHLILHVPNNQPFERPAIFEITETQNGITINK